MSQLEQHPMEDDELRRTVGKLFVVGFHGHSVSEDIKTLIRPPYNVGAVILFQRNVRDAEQLRTLTLELQQTARAAGHTHPLLIGIDQENGVITRIRPPTAAQLPGAMAQGATGEPANARQISRATAETLKAVGIKMNYAPICDVNSNMRNPVTGARSFGDNPVAVARFAAASWTGLREHGVVPCAKHFPGHGDAAVDSYVGLPFLDKTWKELEECELVPFRRAVADGVEMIMTAHIIVGGGDGEGETQRLPVTLHAPSLANLRKRLGYDGVIVSDCLEMDAVRTECGGTVEGAVTALRSGCDSVMVCHTLELQISALENVCRAVKDSRIPLHQIRESAERMRKIKEKYLEWDAQLERLPASHLDAINKSSMELAKAVYAKSTTLVRSAPDILPRRPGQNIVLVLPAMQTATSGAIDSGEDETPSLFTDAETLKILRRHNRDTISLRCSEGKEWHDQLSEAVKSADTVIFAGRNASLIPSQRTLGLELARAAKTLIVLATCDPYDFLPDDDIIKNYITMYEPTLEAFEAAVNVIFGIAKPTGILPVLNSSQTEWPIQAFDPERDMAQLTRLWEALIPDYCVSPSRLAFFLRHRFGAHFAVSISGVLVGFIATFTSSGAATGLIALLLVDERYQRQGLGSALLSHARRHLTSSPNNCTDICLASSFPRLFPGLPTDVSVEARSFFVHRGYQPGETYCDLYRDIRHFIAPAEVMRRARDSGVTFALWTGDGEAECLAKQQRFFGDNREWVAAYETLARLGLHDQVLVAHHVSDGSQVGWTLMLHEHRGAPFLDGFTMPGVPAGQGTKTGLVACVGVDPAARGRGFGLAMIASAMDRLRDSGIEGVFVDWVVLLEWYAKLGLRPLKEYRRMLWKGTGS